MKILILTNDLYPYLNANSEIAHRLAKELAEKHGCEVTMLGYNYTKDAVFPEPPAKIHTVRMKTVTDYYRLILTVPNKGKRNLKLLMHPRQFRFGLRCRRDVESALTKEYQAEVLRVIRRQKIDCILAFCNPRSTLRALAELDIPVPFISCMLDPWSTCYTCTDVPQARAWELAAGRKAAKIIATNLIQKDYESFAPGNILQKMTVLEFPNVIHYDMTDKQSVFRDRKIHCVFAGSMYKRIREPRYAVELFEKLKDAGIVLDILGSQEDGTLLPEPLPPNVVYHGQVSSDEAMGYMQAADILVNIGNTILNQMPSKIFTYLSLGTPILNLVQDVRCPTLPYLADYPNALNILETERVQERDLELAKNFILETYGKKIPFEEIQKRYETCTLEYVGRNFMEILREVTQTE